MLKPCYIFSHLKVYNSRNAHSKYRSNNHDNYDVLLAEWVYHDVRKQVRLQVRLQFNIILSMVKDVLADCYQTFPILLGTWLNLSGWKKETVTITTCKGVTELNSIWFLVFVEVVSTSTRYLICKKWTESKHVT